MKAYTSNNFRVRIRRLGGKFLLTQQVLDRRVSTVDLPTTYQVLEKSIPTIFDNECFNDANLPFKEEVKKTEVGHLLEHLILENLKIESIKENRPVDFNGQTTWDWYREKYGKFNIEIQVNYKNMDMFDRAFNMSVSLLETIYECVS